MTDQPDPLPVHEAQVRAYAAESGDVVLRRHLTAVLAEYDRLKTLEKGWAVLLSVPPDSMFCPNKQLPPCDWVGTSEAALIEHYREVHQYPTEWAFEQALNAVDRLRAVEKAARELRDSGPDHTQRFLGSMGPAGLAVGQGHAVNDVQAHMRVQDAIETAILDRGVEPPADLADIVFAAARAALEAAPSPLRAELAEAKAEIARLTEQREEFERLLFWQRGVDANIVEAATALVEAWKRGTRQDIAQRVGRLVAAVEEGQKP